LLPLAYLPTLNAALNSASALLLAAGYLFILSGRVAAHRRCMLAAFTTSALFLTSYLIYHYNVGSVPFSGRGWIRGLYCRGAHRVHRLECD
jgi:putative membrane protein